PGITTLRAIQLAEQLTHPATGVVGRDGGPLGYSVSIGISEGQPGAPLGVLLMHADLAMYEAKQAGGGTWRIFGDAARAEQQVTPAEGVAISPSRGDSGLRPD
ncbi:MAG TPA: hypothetical protein VHF26_12745, partial [Trebonia sp.]|nr:hypothetical protein [Trebonia sp.]